MLDEFREMLKFYPELVLISRSPMVVWEGTVTIFENNPEIGDKINLRIKLKLPSYPSVDKASLLFGRHIALLCGQEFNREVKNLLETSESVLHFFNRLRSAIEGKLEKLFQNDFMYKSFDLDGINKLLKELENVLSENSIVEVCSSTDLSAIRLIQCDISITVRPVKMSTGENSWKIISSDMPVLPGQGLPDKKSVSLKEVKNFFQKQVEQLEDFWNQMHKLDQYCWVIDPLHPKPYHLYRRIVISDEISILVTLNPLQPTHLPSIRFLGRTSEVEKYEDNLSEIVLTWDPDVSVYDNLLSLLDIDEFPRAPQQMETNGSEGLFGDNECCICFMMELENGEVPNIICDNKCCKKRFHATCLFQWLQESAANKIIFNQIHGLCPNCSQDIYCLVPIT